MAETKVTYREVRVADFIAEMLEAEANGMPPSYKAQADALREQARIERKRAESSRLITVRTRHAEK